jgi:seryl-tRNA(Sec) selenium transferase
LPLAFGNGQQLETGNTEKLRKAEYMVTYALKQRSTCPMKFLKENFQLHKNWKLEQMSDVEKNLDVYFHIDDYIKACKVL